jgi:hypothetical protein
LAGNKAADSIHLVTLLPLVLALDSTLSMAFATYLPAIKTAAALTAAVIAPSIKELRLILIIITSRGRVQSGIGGPAGAAPALLF